MYTDTEQSPRPQDIINGKKARHVTTCRVRIHLHKEHRGAHIHANMCTDHVWKGIQIGRIDCLWERARGGRRHFYNMV